MSLPENQKAFLRGFRTYIASGVAAASVAATYFAGHIDVITAIGGIALSGAPAALRAPVGKILSILVTLAQDVQAIKEAQQTPVPSNSIVIPVDHTAISNAVAGIVTNAIANKPAGQ